MASTTVKVDVDDDTPGDDVTLATGVNKLTMPEHSLPSPVKPNDDKDNLVNLISNLAPEAQESMNMLLTKILNGEATIKTDADGKAKFEYKPAKSIVLDVSEAHIIAQPKSDTDKQLRLDLLSELIQFIKELCPPSGMLLDTMKISLSKTSDYQLGHDFIETGEVLGRGINGDIVGLKDIKTGEEHANKKMMISCFRMNEIRCWVDLNDTGYVPRLYLVTIDGNKISFHMESLKDAKTLRLIMDDHRRTFGSSDSSMSLIRPFSLFLLDGALEALSEMHRKGWVHKDLHPGNAMMQKESDKTLVVKLVDFGLADRFNSKDGGIDHKGFKDDISEVLRMFSALYCGNAFNDANDIRTNWEKEISDIEMEVDEKEELICLVKAGMDLIQPDDVKEFRNLVKVKLNKAMGDQQVEIMQKLISLLFPEGFQDVHGHTDFVCDNADKGHDVVECAGAQQVSRDSVPPNRANTTGNRDTEASAKLMKQIRKKPASSIVQPE